MVPRPGGPGPDSPVVVTIKAGGICPAGSVTATGLTRFSGGGSSFMQAFSSMLVHLPLVP